MVEEWPILGLCEAIKPHYERAKRDAQADSTDVVKRGVGLGTGSFGIGAAGDTATVSVELDPDGGLTVYGAVADPGEGNDSMLTQTAADMLDLPLDKVRLVTRDTDHTAASGPAAASRLTYMAGGAMVNAIEQLQAAMAQAGATKADATTCDRLKQAGLKTRYLGTKKTGYAGPLDPATGQGPSFESQVHRGAVGGGGGEHSDRRGHRSQDDHGGRRRVPSSTPSTS